MVAKEPDLTPTQQWEDEDPQEFLDDLTKTMETKTKTLEEIIGRLNNIPKPSSTNPTEHQNYTEYLQKLLLQARIEIAFHEWVMSNWGLPKDLYENSDDFDEDPDNEEEYDDLFDGWDRDNEELGVV